MRLRTFVIVAALCLVSARPTFAQDAGQTGLTIAFPAAVGVIWHATDRFAVRPDFLFSQAGSDSLASSNMAVGVGVSALFYVGKWDNVRTYVSPRFGYQRSTFSTTSGAADVSPSTNMFSGAGSFGVQYLPHRRFGIFGEAGLGYSHSATSQSGSTLGFSLSTTSHTWGTRAGVGTIFYF